MQLLRSLLIFMAITLALPLSKASAVAFPNETLNYKVLYKWGLIHKQAGRATLVLRNSGRQYHATLYARSEAWADKFYKLRDTLKTTMRMHDLSPVIYERIAHEDGKFAHDIVKFSRSGNSYSAECTRYRRGKKSENTNVSTTSLQAQGFAVDMVSSFYYLRSLDFNTMKSGATKTVNIFSGKRKELLNITYHGTHSIKLDDRKYETFKITFTFTSEGKKKTSEPIEAWLSTDYPHIPLKLIGKLKIGQIQCIYIPQNK